MESIYIFGHKNPDTDSICSAIAYAYLKNTQAEGHIPARLGDLNRETQFVLSTFDVPEPVFLPHIFVRAEDVMTTEVVSALTPCTVYDVGQLMNEHKIRAVPIVDETGRVQGVVTEHTLARNYLKELHLQGLRDSSTPLGKIANTLNGRLIVGDSTTQVRGNVVIGAMSPEAMVGYISQHDLVVLGNRDNAQEAALHCRKSVRGLANRAGPLFARRAVEKEAGCTADCECILDLNHFSSQVVAVKGGH